MDVNELRRKGVCVTLDGFKQLQDLLSVCHFILASPVQTLGQLVGLCRCLTTCSVTETSYYFCPIEAKYTLYSIEVLFTNTSVTFSAPT